MRKELALILPNSSTFSAGCECSRSSEYEYAWDKYDSWSEHD